MTGGVPPVVASQPGPLWYLSRGSGFAALVLLAVLVALGVLGASRWRSDALPRSLLAGLHRELCWVLAGVVGLHVVTASLDSFAGINLRDAVIPFVTTYRPVWMAMGTIALDVGVLVVLSSAAMRLLGYRTWRAVHWIGYACVPLALLHAFGTGSDTRSVWGFALDDGALALAAGTAAARALVRTPPGVRRTVASAAVGVTAVALLVWAAGGPLRPGWARAAGTPPQLLPPSLDATLAQLVPPGSSDALRGSVSAPDRSTRTLTLVDQRDPALSLALDTTAGAATGDLRILHGPSLLCETTARIGTEISADCDGAVVTIRIAAPDSGTYRGDLEVASGR